MFNDFSIIILSCNSYSDLWDNNIFLLEKNWKNHPNYMIVSDGLGDYYHNQQKNVAIINDQQSNRIIEAVANCKSKYILLTLDDYFISETINNEKIENILMFLKMNNLQYARLYKKPKIKKSVIDKETGYRFLNFLNCVYEVNFYPGIWDKEALLNVLRKNETIWQSEVMLTKRFKNSGYQGIAVYDKKVFPFKDIVRKGKYLRSAFRFLKKEHLYISDRKVRTIKEEVALLIRTFLSDHISYSFKKKLKKLGNKANKSYYSDYYDNNE